MRTTVNIQRQSLRFRRWSRKNYAVFCSLSRSVSIGVLAVSVAGDFVKKSGVHSIQAVFPCFLNDETDISADDLDQRDALMIQAQEITTLEQMTDLAAAGRELKYFITRG